MSPDEPAAGDVRLHLNGLQPWGRDLPGLEESLRRAVRLTLEVAGGDESGELSLTFLDEDAIAELNREWLGREGPTDVLAFELGGEAELLGDVYLCPDVARRSARAEGVAFREELTRLAVHGTLHVLGHDHPEGDDRWSSPMFRLQEDLVARVREEE